jgi:hypothetical protein
VAGSTSSLPSAHAAVKAARAITKKSNRPGLRIGVLSRPQGTVARHGAVSVTSNLAHRYAEAAAELAPPTLDDLFS